MIEVKNLTKYYNNFCAVDGINLEIKKGEILGLLGPNGAGKTTTLRMLTGFFKPTAGDVMVKGISISDNTLGVKELMGYLPESAPLYHNMLVYDYLCYVAKIRGITGDKIDLRLKALSELCGLSNIMHQSINELSKGLKQRVGLAHAMMNDPEILILDEPTSGLDPNQIAEIREIIKRIGKEKTIIFSTHILSEAEATCDRIVIINKGKIVADDSTQKLKNRAASGDSLFLSLYNLNGDNSFADEVLKVLKNVGSNIEIVKKEPLEKGLVSFEIHTNSHDSKYSGDSGSFIKDLRREIYLKIKETDWIIAEFKRESKTLESIFHELTKGN
ncbi:MAG: ATP-binding cassette domain-containing protein [Desulfamplus sp.]|nr:ATP-binding cassette domain-containing protein [Desulfamplus sp.]